jgi:AraC-like DNA-binding protein
MKIYLKNMVCHRCKIMVQSILDELEIPYLGISLGEIDLKDVLSSEKEQQLIDRFQSLGFEWINDRKSQTIERIKTLIIDLVHYQDNVLKNNLSAYLAEDLLQSYAVLSTLFSEVENQTIEHFYIAQKIEKVKELLMYDELTLSEIALKLQYSSVAHLSRQFKKVTGFTPTYFKKLKDKKRQQIDKL